MIPLFAEMYGFPLTIYLASGWLQSHYPGVDWFAHDSGHLLEMLFGWRADPHFGPFHLLSMAFIGGGFILPARAWPMLLTVLMFPVLVWMYGRLALREEQEVRSVFGETYDVYPEAVPRFLPRLRAVSGSSWVDPDRTPSPGR